MTLMHKSVTNVRPFGARVRAGAVLAALCLACGYVDASKSYVMSYHAGRYYADWRHVLPFDLAGWMAWMALIPATAALVRRFPWRDRNWLGRAQAYLLAGLAIAAVRTAFPFLVWAAVLHDWTWLVTFAGQKPFVVYVDFLEALLVYGLAVAFFHARRYYRESRAAELERAELEHRLTTARLDALRMQLNPHFLFNALNAVSALQMQDVAAAQTMLARLGDFLRMTLDAPGDQEVPLAREIEFVRCYLDIERVRFGRRLTAEIDVDAQALQALVPQMILQPLVENALRHGLAPRAAPGTILVNARVQAGRLRLEVADDGVGLPVHDETERPAGIGLRNVQARLRCLYGGQQEFRLSPGVEGGVRVSLTLPLRTAVAA